MTTILHARRLDAVLELLVHAGARRVIDLGCGRGDLLARLVAHPQFEKIVGIDTCIPALAEAQRAMDRREIASGRVTLMYGSFSEGDPRNSRFDAAVMLETLEHVSPRRLSAVELFVFCRLGAPLVLLTTPNREYNAALQLQGREFRHPDHEFEWRRPRFEAWARGVSRRNGYRVEFDGIGDWDADLGAPTQLAIFHKLPEPALRHGSAALLAGAAR